MMNHIKLADNGWDSEIDSWQAHPMAEEFRDRLEYLVEHEGYDRVMGSWDWEILEDDFEFLTEEEFDILIQMITVDVQVRIE